MINEMLLEILKRKVKNGEVDVDEIRNEDYKNAIVEWLKTTTTT